MNENELKLICLQTSVENAIGFRDYYLTKQNYKLYSIWDLELENILDEIRKLNNDQ